MIAVIFAACCVLFALAYIFYGRFVERQLGVDPARPTPAQTHRDNVDYVPTATPILFGHHFSSIAGAGPIVGPIIAGIAFGWLPAILWIVIGAIFVGGVHDFTAIVVSIRNGARSIGQVCRSLMNPLTYYMFLVFILFTLIYVIIVFLDLTATTFAPVANLPAVASEAALHSIRQGGAVASASLFYIAIAVLFGLSLYRLNLRLWLASLIFVPLVFVGLGLGRLFPLTIEHLPAVFGSVKNFWSAVLLLYCLLASVLPVWILLQPRDYLSAYLLYACLGGGAIGLVVSGFDGSAAIRYPAFVGLRDAQLGFIFPTLFVTIACGAVSGFHSLVASGTSSKQLNRESSARVIGYGSMLVEGVLALIALASVMVLSGKVGGNPVAVFAGGIANFVSSLGLPQELGLTFGMLAVSTFLLTTLDTCTRLSRFVFQEIFGLTSRLAARVLSTLAVLALPAFVVFREIPGPGGVLMPAWKAIWPAFGATNQLMAALALLVVYAWLKGQGRKALFVVVPMAFMCVTTLTALVQLVVQNLFRKGSLLVGGLSLVLAALAVLLIVNTFWSLRRTSAAAPTPGPA